jgi:hypothetical protein
MSKLSKQQISNIREAINKAQGPGLCEYQIKGKPACIIGQLASIEGTSPRTMERWEGAEVGKTNPKSLRHYPMDLLQTLQETFDGEKCPVKEARKELRFVLEGYLHDEESDDESDCQF